MRIKDIIIEAPRTGSQTVTRQRVSPELLNMIANKSQYEKELAAVKAAQPKDQTSSPDRDVVNLQGIKVNDSDVQHYADTQDLNFIYGKSRRWFAKNMPEDLLKAVYQDPEWQQAVLLLVLECHKSAFLCCWLSWVLLLRWLIQLSPELGRQLPHLLSMAL